MPYTCNLNTCILKLQDYNFRILVNLGVLRLVCRSFGPERSFGVLTEASVLAEYFRFFLLRLRPKLRPNSSAEASAEACFGRSLRRRSISLCDKTAQVSKRIHSIKARAETVGERLTVLVSLSSSRCALLHGPRHQLYVDAKALRIIR